VVEEQAKQAGSRKEGARRENGIFNTNFFIYKLYIYSLLSIFFGVMSKFAVSRCLE
jgi:hypothetical protein